MTKMSVHTRLEISCLSSVCQGCCTWNARESGSYSVPSFMSTHRKNLAIILSWSLGGICPGALSSPILIEVKKSVITFMSLFVFVLVLLFKFSSKKNTSFLFLYYHTKPFVWYDIFFLIVGILVQVC